MSNSVLKIQKNQIEKEHAKIFENLDLCTTHKIIQGDSRKMKKIKKEPKSISIGGGGSHILTRLTGTLQTQRHLI